MAKKQEQLTKAERDARFGHPETDKERMQYWIKFIKTNKKLEYFDEPDGVFKDMLRRYSEMSNVQKEEVVDEIVELRGLIEKYQGVEVLSNIYNTKK